MSPYYSATGFMLAVLLSGWLFFWAVFPVNDGLVGQMTDADWMGAALSSALNPLVQVALVASAGWAVGVGWVRRRTDDPAERRSGYAEAARVALACALMPLLVGWAGALLFYLTRPIF